MAFQCDQIDEISSRDFLVGLEHRQGRGGLAGDIQSLSYDS